MASWIQYLNANIVSRKRGAKRWRKKLNMPKKLNIFNNLTIDYCIYFPCVWKVRKITRRWWNDILFNSGIQYSVSSFQCGTVYSGVQYPVSSAVQRTVVFSIQYPVRYSVQCTVIRVQSETPLSHILKYRNF